MKKIIATIIVGIFVLSGLGAVATNIETETKTINVENLGNDPKDYTHTVFVEWGSACFCGPCATWSSYIWSAYSGGQYDFEYVTMIVYGHGGWGDILNTKARSWNNLYGFTSYPTNIMDGDYRRQGSSSGTFPGNLDACGNRAVHDLDGTLTVTWQGDAVLDIDIEIENNEGSAYSGYIRVPITEIDSRYTNAYGQKYHFGFLDYAVPMNKAITIPAGGTYTDSVTWDGSQHKDNHGDYFDDIDPENIQVFLGVYNNANGYIDETVAAQVIINQPPNKPTVSGPTDVEPDVEYEYSFVGTDPEEEDIRYWIDWGDSTQGWLGPYPSGETIYVNHTWPDAGIYEVKAKTMDESYNEGDWSDPLIVIVGNLAPDTPEIDGPTSGKVGTSYDYTFTTTDPNGDDVSYFIKWGDGDTEETAFYASGEEVTLSHIWNEQGTWIIEAKAIDPEGAESDWASLEVVMPVNQNTNYSPFLLLLQKIIQRFPILEQLLTAIEN